MSQVPVFATNLPESKVELNADEGEIRFKSKFCTHVTQLDKETMDALITACIRERRREIEQGKYPVDEDDEDDEDESSETLQSTLEQTEREHRQQAEAQEHSRKQQEIAAQRAEVQRRQIELAQARQKLDLMDSPRTGGDSLMSQLISQMHNAKHQHEMNRVAQMFPRPMLITYEPGGLLDAIHATQNNAELRRRSGPRGIPDQPAHSADAGQVLSIGLTTDHAGGFRG